MNRLPSSSLCRICSTDLRARLNACDLVRLRMEFARQMTCGMCDGCQRERHAASAEYENAAAEMRLVTACGAGWSRTKPPMVHPALAQALKRVRAADAACVALKMWPAERALPEEYA